MNVTLPEKKKYSLKDKIMYVTVILVSVICLFAIIFLVVSSRSSIMDMLDITQAEETNLGNKTENEIEALKKEINNKFKNTVEKVANSDNINSIPKIDPDKDIVCTALETKQSKPGSYEINVVLPVININNETVKNYNKEIDDVFKTEMDKVLETKNKNIVYSTEYVASINEDVLSLMIRASIKEGSNAQRTIIRTYNYDIVNNKEVSLSDMLDKNGLNKQQIQKTIRTEIEKSQKRVDALKQAGFSIYNRNSDDKKYDISNSKQFYCTSNTIYIVYAYGNEEFTSEVDVVVI